MLPGCTPRGHGCLVQVQWGGWGTSRPWRPHAAPLLPLPGESSPVGASPHAQGGAGRLAKRMGLKRVAGEGPRMDAGVLSLDGESPAARNPRTCPRGFWAAQPPMCWPWVRGPQCERTWTAGPAHTYLCGRTWRSWWCKRKEKTGGGGRGRGRGKGKGKGDQTGHLLPCWCTGERRGEEGVQGL